METTVTHRASRLCALACALFCMLELSGCGGGLLPAENERVATHFDSYDQVVDAFEQIQPGRTNGDDLVRIGFDPRTGNVDVLSYLGIEERFMPHDSFKFDRLDPAVQTCILSEGACVGYVFHPQHNATKRIGNTFLDLMGFRRITRSEHWSAEVVLLVRNGVVVHKVFSGSPRTENVDDKVQPLGPIQDVGNAVFSSARAAGSF